MTTIGEFLKKTRLNLNMSLDDLEGKTKIKKSFLKAIEAEDWGTLPEYPVVSGFVKSVASSMNVEKEKAVALLRRDYPPKDLPISPKKTNVKEKFKWNPKATFVAGIALVSVVVAGYLFFQYREFTRPPNLEIYSTESDARIDNGDLVVEGQTDPDTTLTINETPIQLNQDGSFKALVVIAEDEEKITVEAESRSGKKTVKEIPIY